MNSEILYVLNAQRAFVSYMENGDDFGWVDENVAQKLHKAAKTHRKAYGWACSPDRYEDAEQALASILADL